MISFIIPALNEEKYIGKTLGYIAQYSGDKEIIVSDANSSDKTVEIARTFTDKVIVHSTTGKRLTIADGRNLGAAQAKGEFLVFLDSDVCIVNPNPLFEKALDCFKNDSKLVGLTISLKVFKEMETISDAVIISTFIYLYVVMNNWLHIGAATGEFQMIRAEVFRKLNGFDNRLVTGEDHDMFRRLSKVGNTRLEHRLAAYHSGRRAHKLGWPKLLYLWTRDTLSIFIRGKSVSEEWTEVR